MAFTQQDLDKIKQATNGWHNEYQIKLNADGEIELCDINGRVITTINEKDLSHTIGQRIEANRQRTAQDQIIGEFLASICNLISKHEQKYHVKLFNNNNGYPILLADNTWTVGDKNNSNGTNCFTYNEIEKLKQTPNFQCINWRQVVLEKAVN